MKRIFTLALALCALTTLSAQVDTVKTTKVDTINVGGMIIIKDPNEKVEDSRSEREISIPGRRSSKTSNISTNWWVLDFGWNNIHDETNYTDAAGSGYLQPNGRAFIDDDFTLKSGKSVNVNIWIFMQRLNVIKHVVNLKYGLGLELYNFRYKNSSQISYREGSPSPYITRDTVAFSKDKLATDYITVPFMLNINTSPRSNWGLSFSAGISAGYMYSNRNKQVSDERGKEKEKGDLGLNRWKLAYIGELGLGPVRLYGSYTFTELHNKGLVQHPYAVGIRFSNW